MSSPRAEIRRSINLFDDIGSEGFDQHALGVVHTAAGKTFPRRSELIELFENRFGVLR